MRKRVGVPEAQNNRVDRKVLKWFGHIERMGSERLTKRVYISEMRGERGRRRQPFRWMDRVRKACAEGGMELEEVNGVCTNRNVWRTMTDRIV